MSGGTGTFTATLKTAGSQSINVNDSAAGVSQSQSVSVSPSTATSLTVTGIPASLTPGTATTVTITAYDAYGNVATGDSDPISFTSTDAQAVLPKNAVLSNGTGQFSVTLKTAGSQSVTEADTPAGISATQNVTVNAAAASKLTLTGLPASPVAGTAYSVTVTAYDSFGNVATGDTDPLTLTSSDGQAVLPTGVSLHTGSATFSITLKTAGAQSVTAADSPNGISVVQNVTVAAGAPSKLTESGLPSSLRPQEPPRTSR